MVRKNLKKTQKYKFYNIIPFSLYELYGVPCGFMCLLVALTAPWPVWTFTSLHFCGISAHDG